MCSASVMAAASLSERPTSGTGLSGRRYRRTIEQAESAPPGSAIEVVTVLSGKVDRQLVFNGIFSQPMQGRLRRLFHWRICVAGYLDMHNERTAPRQFYRVFRHNHLAVEAGVEIKHRDELTWYDHASNTRAGTDKPHRFQRGGQASVRPVQSTTSAVSGQPGSHRGGGMDMSFCTSGRRFPQSQPDASPPKCLLESKRRITRRRAVPASYRSPGRRKQLRNQNVNAGQAERFL